MNLNPETKFPMPATGPDASLGTNQNSWSSVFSTLAGTTNTAALTAASAKAIRLSSDPPIGEALSTGRGFLPVPPQQYLRFRPYCIGADTATCGMKLWEWRFWTQAKAWVPHLIAHLALTAGGGTFSLTSAAGVATTYRWIDTIVETVDVGPSSNGVIKIEPGTPDDATSSIIVDFAGAQIIEAEMSCLSGGTNPTSVNGIWTTY